MEVPGCLPPNGSPTTPCNIFFFLVQALCISPQPRAAFFPQLCVFLIHPSCKGQLCPRSSPDASTVPTSAGGQEPRGSGRIMAPM